MPQHLLTISELLSLKPDSVTVVYDQRLQKDRPLLLSAVPAPPLLELYGGCTFLLD